MFQDRLIVFHQDLYVIIRYMETKSPLTPILIVLLIICLAVIGYFLLRSEKTPLEEGNYFQDISQEEISPSQQGSQPSIPPQTNEADLTTKESYENQFGFMTGWTLLSSGNVLATVDLISPNPNYNDETFMGSPYINNQIVLKKFLISSTTQFQSGCTNDGILRSSSGVVVNNPQSFASYTDEVRTHLAGQPYAEFGGNLIFMMKIQNGSVQTIFVPCT